MRVRVDAFRPEVLERSRTTGADAAELLDAAEVEALGGF
jgi:hypothetical protein